MEMEKVKELLVDILKELKFHGKLLSSMVEVMDARGHEQSRAKIDIQSHLDKIAENMGSSPRSGVIKDIAKTMGGKHGD